MSLNDCVWTIPSGKTFSNTSISTTFIISMPMEGTQHDFVSRLVNDFLPMRSHQENLENINLT